MEWQTLFKRECVADPFFIRLRLMQKTPSSVPILIVAYPLFRTGTEGWKAGSNGLKMAACVKKTKNLTMRARAFLETRISWSISLRCSMRSVRS
jgi:hypothetical protein